MAWVYLIAAGLFEIGFTAALRFTEGFTKFWPSVVFVGCASASFFLFERAVREIPLGTGYAIWVGFGAAGAVIVGALLFDEPMGFWRMFFITTLMASVVGLKFVSD